MMLKMNSKLFYFDLAGKNFGQKILSKNYVMKWRKRKRFKNCRFHVPGWKASSSGLLRLTLS